jgi:hypothetical protein
MSTFVATDPEGYEPCVGRWSRRLAPLFVASRASVLGGNAYCSWPTPRAGATPPNNSWQNSAGTAGWPHRINPERIHDPL